MASTFLSQLGRTAPAVVLGAVVGGLGTKPTSRWYRSLDTPSWQPPAAVFGPVWTALYALTAGGTAAAMARAPTEEERAGIERALWVNMALNAGWCWLFFSAQRPRAALVEIVVLEASTVLLARQVAAIDKRAGLALAPYAAWNGFASALNAEIARRN